MSSIHTTGTCGTRTVTQTVMDFFLSVKSGLKTPYGSPTKKGTKEHVKTPPPKDSFKFKSLVTHQQNIKILQAQRSKRKKQAREQKNMPLENEDLHVTTSNLESLQPQTITYSEMLRQRKGIKGPVRPYKVTKFKPNGYEDLSSLAETISIYNCRSNLTMDKREYSIKEDQFDPEFFVQKSDLDMIFEGSNSWYPSPAWPGKKVGFRGLRAEHFKSRFRALENEVCKFQMDSREIQEILFKRCKAIAEKQHSTSEFLQYTQIYDTMFTPIERDIYNIEQMIERKEELQTEKIVEMLVEEFHELKQKYKHLPEFMKSSWVKRSVSDANLYELSQFCTLIINHSNHEKKMSEQFRGLKLQYDGHDYLMREYIWKLWYHFDILRRGFSDSSWLRFFSKFKLALERSTRENYEGHQKMNSIICRMKGVTRSMQYIDKRIGYIKLEVKRSLQ